MHVRGSPPSRSGYCPVPSHPFLGHYRLFLKVVLVCDSIRRMKNIKLSMSAARTMAGLLVLALAIVSLGPPTQAESWGGIQPLKSRRADVERLLGAPLDGGDDATLHFNVAGGSVTVSFVTAKFIANKKLSPELEGTVLQIVLQHQRSSDTPESLNLSQNHNFDRQDEKDITVYRNLKGGVTYTFINGTLRTTRYSPSADQLAKSRK